ncbi:hypothetical protein QS306_06385 [Paraburkholderia bonniea]|nr:hypothetical protein [Paraburkholderia bonniea]WJF91255.1 hypothetical protein QS306_06385 [Paraburkholderia bonniea]WJF94570.1 hypothetical protein QS308_06395 [Paraburkholderia bonniea]
MLRAKVRIGLQVIWCATLAYCLPLFANKKAEADKVGFGLHTRIALR